MKNSYLILISISTLLISCKEEKGNSTSTNSIYPGWKTYKAPDLTLQYPKGWFITVDTSEGEVFHISKSESDRNALFVYDISLQYYPETDSFEEFVTQKVKEMEKEYGIEKQKEKRTAFDSKDAYEFIFEFPTDAGRNDLAGVYFIDGSGKYYMLFNAGQSEYKPQADSIIQTIQLK